MAKKRRSAVSVLCRAERREEGCKMSRGRERERGLGRNTNAHSRAHSILRLI